MKRKIRKGDKVVVLTGRDRGRQGEVLRVLPQQGRVVVRGVATVKRHQRPTAGSAGGIETRESPIHISNVALIDPESGAPTRVRLTRDKEGNPRRIAVRSGKQIEA